MHTLVWILKSIISGVAVKIDVRLLSCIKAVDYLGAKIFILVRMSPYKPSYALSNGS